MDIQKRLLIEKKDVSLHYQNNKTNDNVKTQNKIYTIELDALVLLSEKLVTFKEWEWDAEGSRSWRESLSHLIYSKGITSTSDRNKGKQTKDSRLSSCPLF